MAIGPYRRAKFRSGPGTATGCPAGACRCWPEHTDQGAGQTARPVVCRRAGRRPVAVRPCRRKGDGGPLLPRGHALPSGELD
jgi:hypothetical protein